MKKLIIIYVVAFLAQRVSQAQGTIYFSNLGQPSAGTVGVGSDQWLAALFGTGTNASGYLLDSVELGLADATGNPNGFTVMIYNNGAPLSGAAPGSSLDTLTGSLNPTTAGTYTYTPASSLTLLPNTYYFIVLTAGTAIADGAYEWNYESIASYNPVDGWGGGGAYVSSNGSLHSWYVPGPPFYYPELAITAEPIPEPGVLSLFALSGLVFLWHRRNAKVV
jgi:hypothetical protein